MILDIVIPALNEENAIRSIIERCLAAKEKIKAVGCLSDVTVTVVSDGSTDRTESIARSFEPAIRIIAYHPNQGYGAAIKNGFALGSGEIVGFLDADGTCDPEFFGPLVAAMKEKKADICLGARINPKSKMPLIRKIGNIIWRNIINWIARSDITDAASGMRVIRRSSLEYLEPLPTGLHYTPTMSCRAALDARLSITELPMAYEERIGRSKLSVVKDGWRFLKTILDVGLTYQPFRMFSLPGFILLLVSAWLIAPTGLFYIENRMIRDGDIYRILTAIVFACSGFQLFLAGLIGEKAVDLVLPKKWSGGALLRFMKHLVYEKTLLIVSGMLLAMAFFLNAEGMRTYISFGMVYEHWSRAAVGGLMVILAFQCFAGAVQDRLLKLLLAGKRLSGANSEKEGVPEAPRESDSQDQKERELSR